MTAVPGYILMLKHDYADKPRHGMTGRRTGALPCITVVRIVAAAVLTVTAILAVRIVSLQRRAALLQEKVVRCRQYIDSARGLDASRYAPETFEAAQQGLAAVMERWTAENDRGLFTRDLAVAAACADSCGDAAQRLVRQTIHARDSLQACCAAQLASLDHEITEIRARYGALPMSRSVRTRLVQSELLLSEGRALVGRHDYKAAAEKLSGARSKAGQVREVSAQLLENYVTALPQWRQWVAQTIGWSRKNSRAAIVVVKMERACRLYVDGALSAEYRAEFGPNWLAHKRYQGDKATPEGQYRICAKKGPGQSKYHRALVFDYPNEEDRRAFAAAKKRGELPASAGIGSLLEIHGGGGKYADWTDGCVALRNEDMDALFGRVAVGTPVTIVGSLDGK